MKEARSTELLRKCESNSIKWEEMRVVVWQFAISSKLLVEYSSIVMGERTHSIGQ